MSLDADYFDALYDRKDDPWRLEERWYERRKRALTMGVLPRERFARALEVGCSIGMLTSELAARCAQLVATDIAPRPVELARERLAGASHVEFSVMNAPEEWPDGSFDLVVLSEVGYYLDEPTLRQLFARSIGSLTPDGVIVACHWRHPVTEYPLRGDRVHDILGAMQGIRLLAAYVDDDFRLDVIARAGAVSVAENEGLVSSP